MFKIKENNERFESVEEFIYNMQRGGEVEFLYNYKKYSITRQDTAMYLIEIGNIESERKFTEINDLLNFNINNCTFREVITKIEPYFRCF